MQSQWGAIGLTLAVLFGVGLISDKTQKIAIYIALALTLVLALHKFNNRG